MAPKRFAKWLWRPGGRRARRWIDARIWAEQMNDLMNTLPQEQQDQLDAQLRNKMLGQ